MGLEQLFGSLFGKSGQNQEDSKKVQTQADTLIAVSEALKKSKHGIKSGIKIPKSIEALQPRINAIKAAVNNNQELEAVKEFKESRADISSGARDSASAIGDILSGETAKLQLSAILGRDIPSDLKITNGVFEQMGVLTSVNEMIQGAAIAGEIASVGQIDRIGDELRSYIDYSGLSQLTGFGYGQILNTALGEPLNQEVRSLLQHTVMDVNSLLHLRQRGIIDEDYFFDNMAKNGFSKDASERLVEGYFEYPSGEDFIRFAVRDVFNPSVVEMAGLDDMFPEDILPYAAKAGMSEQVLRWNWRAHWQLPSPQMAYEMLHRRIISEDELKQLLKVADWAPGYIDALMAISYNPLTRVDARRMWETGVLSDEGFRDAMKDLGYNDKNADLYLEWVKKRAEEPEKDLTKSVVINAYKWGLIDYNAVISYMQGFGYSKEESELIIAIEDRKLEQKDIQDAVKLAQWEYSRFELTEKGFKERMSELGIPTTKGGIYLIKADADRIKRGKLPSKDDVKRWYKAGNIKSDEAGRYLTRMGYRAHERDLYIREWSV